MKTYLFPSGEIIDTSFFNIHQDRETPIPGFFIIELKRKANSISEFSNSEAEEFIYLLKRLRKGMSDILKIKEVYLFQNEDSKHGFHLWVFPRLDWMDDFGRKIQSVRPIMDYAEKNLASKKVISEVKRYVKEMKKYMTTI